MKQRFKALSFVLLLITFVAFPVLAQDVDLDETYEDDETGLSFNYPDGWEITVEDEISIIITPDGAKYRSIDDVEFIIMYASSDEMMESLGLESDMSAMEAMEQIIDLRGFDEIITGDMTELESDNYDGVWVSISDGDAYGILSVIEADNGLLIVLIDSPSEESFEIAEPIFFDLLATIEYESTSGEALELDETFEDDESGLSFSYPGEWEVDAGTTEFILVPPRDSDFGSIWYAIFILDQDTVDDMGIVIGTGAEETMQALIDISGEDISYDDITLETYGENVVATIELTNDSEYVLASIVETPEEFLLINLTGDENQVNSLRDTYFAILETLSITGD